LVTNRRAIETSTRDQSWLRLLDVQAALSARIYFADGSLVMKIRDPLFDENASSFAVTVEDGRASIGRTEAEPDVELDVADLATMYLGGTRLSTLVQAGRAIATAPSIPLADVMFSSPRAPFASLFF
jgi:predicted acetyltransferase